MDALGGEFFWESWSDQQHIPSFGDILVTLAHSDAVGVKFWEHCDSSPQLSLYRGAWVLAISDMRTISLENAGVGNGMSLPDSYRALCVYKWEQERNVWMFCGNQPQLVPLPLQAGLGCLGETEPSCHNVCLVFQTNDGPTRNRALEVNWWNVTMPISRAVVLGVWDKADSTSDMVKRRLSKWIGGRGVSWRKEGPTYQIFMRKSAFDNRIEFGPVL